MRASSSARVDRLGPVGRSTAAQIVRVATSITVGQLDPAGDAVVEQRQHVQRGGVDLHQLTRAGRDTSA